MTPWRAGVAPEAGGGEEGLSLVETVVAGAITLVVIMAVFITSWVVVSSSESANEEADSTAPTALAANAVEQLVDNAVVPDGTTAITSDCTDSNGNGLTGSYGPFVYAGSGDPTSLLPTSTTLSLCSVRPGSTTAYTYEISFTTCGGGSCLAVDRVSCTGNSCSTMRVDDFPGLTSSNPSGNSPFTYFESSPSWTQVTPEVTPTSNLGQISAITVDFSVPTSPHSNPTSHDNAQPAEVSRTVVLPGTLGGYT